MNQINYTLHQPLHEHNELLMQLKGFNYSTLSQGQYLHFVHRRVITKRMKRIKGGRRLQI